MVFARTIVESVDVSATRGSPSSARTNGLRGPRSMARSTRVADKAGVLDRRVKGDLGRFRDFIEQRGGRETGAWRGEVDRPQP
jgi:hypothetical protein